MQSPLEAIGHSYNNFVITKYLPLEEIQSTLIELVHTPSGARVMHIANPDPENLFCLSFQTLPYNSNGIAHILEHIVLCGSKKFPVKDPFFAMTRRSLNTYMNALTGADFTCYPASSQVEKDFYNLLEVYLDAVFFPELKKLSFLQEGHRIEFNEDKSALQFQGVVYNEMKGAMSSIDSRLWKALLKHLMPDLPYAHNSGGDPKDILSLTHSELLAFHKEYYHPSRCLFFFYGNLPLKKHLDYLDSSEIFQNKIPPLVPIPLQPRFQTPVLATEKFPVRETESLEKKTQIAFAWLTAPISQQNELLALSLLDTILTDNDASPLTLALLQSGLCTQASSSLDGDISEVPFAIVCKGCEEQDADGLQKVIFDTLRSFVPTQEQIHAAIHQLEFERLEMGSDGMPFGLILFFRAALLKQHGSESENSLLIHSLFSDLRERVKDPEYLPQILKKYVLENPHFVRLVLKPDPHLEKEELLDEQKRLSEIRAALTKEEEKEIVKQSAQLASYQESIERQSLDCLPKLTLSDVPKGARDFPLVEQKNVFHHACFTNHILYADLVFDLPEIKEEDLPLLSVFTRIVTELGCGGRNYIDTLAYQQLYTGEMDAGLSLHVLPSKEGSCKPTLTLKGKALKRNQEKLLKLFADYATKIDFDESRIKEWLLQHKTQLQNRLTKNALNYAIQSALSGFSIPSFIYEKWHGVTYYQAVMHWASLNIEQFVSLLKNLASILFSTPPHLVLSCDEKMYCELKDFCQIFEKLPHKKHNAWTENYLISPIDDQARIIAAPVAFTAVGMRTISYAHEDAPYLLIASELMQNTILHKEIREKGGAYGSGANYAPSTGNFHFYSYRDPHVTRTIGVFEKAVLQIGAKKFDDEELEEAILGVLQTLDAPVSPGNRAIVAYSWKRAGRTKALREQFRNKVLEATKEQVAQSCQKHLADLPKKLVTYLGQEVLKKEKLHLPVLPIEQ